MQVLLTQPPKKGGDGDDYDDDDDFLDEEAPRDSAVFADPKVSAMDGAGERVKAKTVIMDWAKKLQGEWEKCEPVLTEKGEKTLKVRLSES